MLIDYQGREIRFPEERWQHIIGEHPVMALMEEVIGETLLDPDGIFRDPEDPDSIRLYYRWFYGIPLGDGRICVVVKVFNGDAFVISSFPASHIKGDEVIWTKSTA